MRDQCSVLPPSKSRAWRRIPRTASNESIAAAGLPGRLSRSVVPRTPQIPRLKAAKGVFLAPSRRIRSGMPGIRRCATAKVASGVTSRTAIPVPPTVTTSRAVSAHAKSSFSISSCSSGAITVLTIWNPADSSLSQTAGPEVSFRLPWEDESLMVSTAAVFTG